MADPQQPPLRTWQVAICCGEPGEAPFMAQNVLVAANPETAAAMVAGEMYRAGLTQKPVIGVLVAEVRPEFMRAALNGGQPAPVVPLSVVKPPNPQDLTPVLPGSPPSPFFGSTDEPMPPGAA